MNANDVARAVDYAYPEKDLQRIRAALAPSLAADQHVYVVVDDDPTGGQTVHDVDLYTEWSPETMREAFRRPCRMFYVMTNSRSMTEEKTIAVYDALIPNVLSGARAAGKRVRFINRGDSTLRGHFPLEPDYICGRLGNGARQLLIPFFREGKRYTVGDVHYLLDHSRFVPVGESEFGRDKSFGYHSSNLPDWVAEKTRGRVPREAVGSIPLDMLRSLDFAAVEAALRSDKRYIVVNAACEDDLRAFAVGYLRAEGTEFVARSASSWPKIIGGVETQPLLESRLLINGHSAYGGLVVVGSHVEKTNRQLRALLEGIPELLPIELNQHLAPDADRLEQEIARVSGEANAALTDGRTCVIYTRRNQLDAGNGREEDELRITQRIAGAVCDAARRIRVKPRFLIAKGGITSSDIATQALHIRHAVIMGQIEPGVPVWMPEKGSRFDHMPFVIFPGNVGEEDTLKRVVQKLMDQEEEQPS